MTSPIAPRALDTKPATLISDSSPRASNRRMQHLLAQAPQIQPMGMYVGQLQERWQFPSDHLPIGMTYQDVHIASWNVLDAEYMNWVIEKDSQGLKRSLIVDEHIYIGDTGLTVRDQHVANLVVQMINHPTHPRSLLSLQECSKPFTDYLQTQLPPHFQVILNDGNVIVVDTTRFEVVDATAVSGVFSGDERSFQDLVLRNRDSQEPLRILNAHLPGDPKGPARYEFLQYLATTYNPTVPTIAMGDMNFNELEMNDAIFQAFSVSPFSLYSPYCTNISVAAGPNPFFSKAIDHFISTEDIKLNAPDEVMTGLKATHELLN